MMQNPMEQSSVRKAVIYMSLPPMASMFLQFLYFVVDSIFVARLGEVPLVGVTTIFPLQTLMTAMAIFVGVGATCSSLTPWVMAIRSRRGRWPGCRFRGQCCLACCGRC